MSTPYIHLDFVCLSDYSNQRARELTTSFARSHASKVTYLKKKKKKSARASGRTFEDQHENKALLDVCARIQAARDGLPASDSPLTYVPHTINYCMLHLSILLAHNSKSVSRQTSIMSSPT